MPPRHAVRSGQIGANGAGHASYRQLKSGGRQGRRVRARGGRDDGIQDRRITIGFINVNDNTVSGLPLGVPLETPLRVKQPRRYTTPREPSTTTPTSQKEISSTTTTSSTFQKKKSARPSRSQWLPPTPRTSANDFDMTVGFINVHDNTVSGLPLDKPLETPLSVKRPRRYKTPRATETPIIYRETSPTPSTSRMTTPSPSILQQLSTSCDPDFESIFCSGSDQNYTHQSSQNSNQDGLQNTRMNNWINHGSEEDSDDEENDADEDYFDLSFIPRAQRIYYDNHEEHVPLSPPGSPCLPCQAEVNTELEYEPMPQPSSKQFEPTNLYNFEWRHFPDPPVPMTERREVFSEINCGPSAPFLTPYDAFIAIWSRDFMEYIAAETNRYAQEVAENKFEAGSLGPSSSMKHWHDTNADELYLYFALLLAQGLCVKTELSEYWTNEDLLSTPNFSKQMSHKRYLHLSRCLHFNDNKTDISSLSGCKAKVYKISPVIDHLNSKFQELYRLGRNIAINESLTQWKSWLNVNQVITKKDASVDISTYEVCEAETGYLWRFKLYAGREEAVKMLTPVSGNIPTLLLELLRGLENKGRTVWMDGNYNSPALARVLKSVGFDCVGPLRTNVPCVPQSLASLEKNDMAVGEVTGLTSGDVDILVWRGQNRVGFISTYHGIGDQAASEKTKPNAIHDYNLRMHDIDKKDQMLSMYPIEQEPNKVWYKKIFRRLLNVSILNSYILHKQTMKTVKPAYYSYRDFRKTLIVQLLENHKGRTIITLSGETKEYSGILYKVANVPIFTDKVLKHFPKECRKYGRSPCAVCLKRTSYYCPACNIPLCLDCTTTFHQ